MNAHSCTQLGSIPHQLPFRTLSMRDQCVAVYKALLRFAELRLGVRFGSSGSLLPRRHVFPYQFQRHSTRPGSGGSVQVYSVIWCAGLAFGKLHT
ncbi:hypothetical protein PENSPDRAFT_755299, partial [Peniophora sp. CONT]